MMLPFQSRFLTFTCFVLLASSPFTLLSQQSPLSSSSKELLQEKVHHLLRVADVDSFLSMVKQQPQYFLDNENREGMIPSSQSQAIKGETLISDRETPESELHAAMHPNDSNQMVVAVMQQDVENFQAPFSMPIYYTRDFGASWSISDFDGATPEMNLWAGGGDPVLVYDAGGTLHYTYLVLDINPLTFEGTIAFYYATSSDQGESWEFQEIVDRSAPFDLFTLEGIDKFIDKQWMAVDRSGGEHHNQVYMAYVELEFDSLNSPNLGMKLRWKAEDSTGFNEAVDITTDTFNFVQFASIDVDPSGDVHVTFVASIDSIEYAMYHTVSTNGGQTFSSPVKISPLTLPHLTYQDDSFSVEGISPDRLYPCPHVKVDPSSGSHAGRIYTFWTANGVGSPTSSYLNIYFSYSDDGGLHWSEASPLDPTNQEKGHQYYASPNITKQGRIVVTYYDRSAQADGVSTNYVLTESSDGGESWIPTFSLTGESSDFSQIGTRNEGFGIGEYNQTLCTDYQAIPFWADGRTNDGNINIYAAFAPFGKDYSTSTQRWQSIHRTWNISNVAPNPMPAGGTLQLEIESSEPRNIQWEWIAPKGQILHRYNHSTALGPQSRQNIQLQAPHQSGVYFLKASSRSGEILVQKVILQ